MPDAVVIRIDDGAVVTEVDEGASADEVGGAMEGAAGGSDQAATDADGVEMVPLSAHQPLVTQSDADTGQ